MKKLTRISLDELAQVMPVLSEWEQKQFVGGDIFYMDRFGRIDPERTEICPGRDQILTSPDPADSESTGFYIDIPYGMKLSSYDFSDNDSGAKTNKGLLFEDIGASGNYANEKKFFEQLVQGTDVEWGWATNKKNGGGKLFSSHQGGSVDCGPAYTKGYDSLTHSHAQLTPNPGGYELDNQQSVEDESVQRNLRRKDKNGERIYDYKEFDIYVKSEDDYGSY